MFELDFSPPTALSFMQIRQSVSWDNCSTEVTTKSIENTLFWVSLYKDNQLIATGRVMGDGAMYFYIQDVIVSPSYQNRGLGNQIMEHIEKYLLKNATKYSTVGLFAAKGKEGFYQKYGYLIRDGQHLGQALCKFV
jgi:ribosomal protein S18 acetylase RimI-like enzyme